MSLGASFQHGLPEPRSHRCYMAASRPLAFIQRPVVANNAYSCPTLGSTLSPYWPRQCGPDDIRNGPGPRPDGCHPQRDRLRSHRGSYHQPFRWLMSLPWSQKCGFDGTVLRTAGVARTHALITVCPVGGDDGINASGPTRLSQRETEGLGNSQVMDEFAMSSAGQSLDVQVSGARDTAARTSRRSPLSPDCLGSA